MVGKMIKSYTNQRQFDHGLSTSMHKGPTGSHLPLKYEGTPRGRGLPPPGISTPAWLDETQFLK